MMKLPEDLERLTPIAEYQQIPGRGFVKVATMESDPEGDFVGIRDLAHRLNEERSEARNRWEQEVRERLLELADKFEAEAGPNGPKQCQCCRKANKQLLDLAATFGEAEPVEGENGG